MPINKCIQIPNPVKRTQKNENKNSLTIEEMASRIAAIRPTYPHLSINPLAGNTLY